MPAVETWTIASPTLGGDVLVVSASQPGGRVAWLLHGRTAAPDEVVEVVQGVAATMEAGQIAPRTLIAPCDPHPGRSSWWVDAPAPDGLAVEGALLHDVFPEAERRTGGIRRREDRTVCGYSMGGGGALRYVLVHRELFSSAALVSPAAFDDPPVDSSVMTTGVFATAESLFDHESWRRLLHYPTLLAQLPEDAGIRIAIVVGDGEPLQDYPFGRSSLTMESARLHTALTDHPGTSSALRVTPGGHTREFWAPSLTHALGLLE